MGGKSSPESQESGEDPGAPREHGQRARASSLSDSAGPWGRMRPRACPQGGPRLVMELKTNPYCRGIRNAKASLTHLHMLWTPLGGLPGGSDVSARPGRVSGDSRQTEEEGHWKWCTRPGEERWAREKLSGSRVSPGRMGERQGLIGVGQGHPALPHPTPSCQANWACSHGWGDGGLN